MAIRGRKSSSKSPPIFSNEFIIQNHADIVACVVMQFVIWSFVNATQPYVAPFVTLQHNTTEVGPGVTVHYKAGIRDVCFIFFATLIMIVLHAILQEYVLDKMNRKAHLSKTTQIKFNVSGQLAAFYAMSAIWAANILYHEGVLPMSLLYANFPGPPHDTMVFGVKMFFIAQIAYWLHMYAELYFERVKREDFLGRISQATVHMVLFLLAYCLNLWRVGLLLATIHYSEQALRHVARLAHFYSHPSAKKLFSVWNFVFVAARLVTTAAAFLVFWFGLPQSMFTLRVAGLSLIGATQLHMLFAFLSFHISRIREPKFIAQKPPRKNKDKGKAPKAHVDRSLPEADQRSAPGSPVAARAAENDVKLSSDTKVSPNSINVKKRLKARS